MSHLLISAAHKSSGKTTITLGLCAALRQQGVVVQPFKKGPDYIDPLWLTQAAQRSCYNLDFHNMSTTEIRTKVAQHLTDADIGIIEGNKGLYDGVAVNGSNSNAALAHLLDAPVVLVLDTQGMTRGIAPLLLGYQAFDQALSIAGVILNNVGGERHASKLHAVIERYCDIPVIGTVQRDAALRIDERHLGLLPSNEHGDAAQHIERIAQHVAAQVDLDALQRIAAKATTIPASLPSLESPVVTSSMPSVRIGVVRDSAFGFYYPDDLAALQQAGATLVYIDALKDTQLPAVDGLFIGGGFPETHMTALAENVNLKQSLANAVENDMPVYAECGGLIYLAKQLTWHGQTCDMVGALPFSTVMDSKPHGRGYVQLQETGQGLWEMGGAQLPAHEFHYSRAVDLPTTFPYAYEVLRGTGLDGKRDGFIYRNTLACYAHMRDVTSNPWTQRFVHFIRQQQQNQ